MRLALLLDGADRLMGAQTEMVLEHGSLIIGRSPSADWTLPDAARMISKFHCRVDSDLSGFVLTDTSTNGVKVNEELVGFGLPRLLMDGDVLQLGDAVILVRIENESAPSGSEAPTSEPTGVSYRSIETADGPFGRIAEPPHQSTTSDGANHSIDKILDQLWPTQPPITDVKTNGSALQAPGHGEEKFAILLDGVDLAGFAAAVCNAVEVLPTAERRKFRERLNELIEAERTESPDRSAKTT